MTSFLAGLSMMLLAVFALIVSCMAVAGDLRVTRRSRREWEESWTAMSEEGQERLRQLYWGDLS